MKQIALTYSKSDKWHFKGFDELDFYTIARLHFFFWCFHESWVVPFHVHYFSNTAYCHCTSETLKGYVYFFFVCITYNCLQMFLDLAHWLIPGLGLLKVEGRQGKCLGPVKMELSFRLSSFLHFQHLYYNFMNVLSKTILQSYSTFITMNFW